MAKLLDPYEVLRVERSASRDEIRAAYRELARKNHPDVDGSKEAAERMIRVNAAWGILGDPDKRTAFDRGAIDAEGSRQMTIDDLRRALFDSIFRGPGGIFSPGGWPGGPPAQPVGTAPPPPAPPPPKPQPDEKKDELIWLPENDWGLLAALVAARISPKRVVGWRVYVDPEDQREWLKSEPLYLVYKDGDEIRVFRRVEDWRRESDRGKPIVVNRREGKTGVRVSSFAGYVGTDVFKDPDLEVEGIRPPKEYRDYLTTVENLAARLAQGRSEFRLDPREMERINNLSYLSNYVTREGGLRGKWRPEMEIAKGVEISEFQATLERAQGRLVEVEPRMGKEGQRPSATEGLG